MNCLGVKPRGTLPAIYVDGSGLNGVCKHPFIRANKYMCMVEATITFDGQNRVVKIECQDGAEPLHLMELLEKIEEDPLWLQSPADRQTDAYTEVSVTV